MTVAVSALPLGSLARAIGFVRSLAHGKRGQGGSSYVFFDGMPRTRAASDAVLIASDRADLDDRLDEMFVGLLEFGVELESMDERNLESIEGDEAFERVLGKTPAAKLEAGAIAALPRLEALGERLKRRPRRMTERDPSATWDILVDAAYEPSIPRAARKTFVKVMHGVVAGLVIMRAVELGGRLEPWFAMALADVVTVAMDEGLRALDTLLGIIEQGEGDLAPTLDRFAHDIAAAERYEEHLISLYSSPEPEQTVT